MRLRRTAGTRERDPARRTMWKRMGEAPQRNSKPLSNVKIRLRVAAIDKATRTSLPMGRDAIPLGAPKERPVRTMEELYAKHPRIQESMRRINQRAAEKKATLGQPANESKGKIAEGVIPAAKPRPQPMSTLRRRELTGELQALENEIAEYREELATQRYKKKPGRGFFASAGQLLKNIWKGGQLFERVRPFRYMLTKGDITDRKIRLQNTIKRRDMVRTELAGAQAQPEERTAQAAQRAQQPASQQAASRAPPKPASEQATASVPPQPAAQEKRRWTEIRKKLTPAELEEYYRNRRPAQSGGPRTEIRPKLAGEELREAHSNLRPEGGTRVAIRPKIEPAKKAPRKGKEENVA